jgi:hypothetical protein
MNDQTIYECIALNGPMTAEAIAEAMRVDVNDAIEHLAALRGIGDLVLTDGAYSFSRGFAGSEDGQRARRKAAAILQGRAAAGETPLDKALNFLVARGGTCLSWEMHSALGLQQNELASEVLSDALAEGRLFREGKHWFLDRRAAPRSAQAELEEDLASGQARRVEIVAIPGSGAIGHHSMQVTGPIVADEAPSLDWWPVRNCNTTGKG